MDKKKLLELRAGCLDCFAYGGYDVRSQLFTAPDAELKKREVPLWYLYQYGEYVGQWFENSLEATHWIDAKNEEEWENKYKDK